jgi:hypothetical protein
MDKITRAMLVRIFEGSGFSWRALGAALVNGQEQGHLLLQLDDPAVSALAARRGWDGALRYPGNGDFLAVVDANVGFNKTNAVVTAALAYDVDLTDPAQPSGTLSVTHTNNASAEVPCLHWGGQRLAGQEAYPIDACYWNYMRVYTPVGAQLLEATPQSVPGGWMLLDRGVQAPVDLLDEKLEGLQGFGALMVVPGGGSQLNGFEWRLPPGALQREADRARYVLYVKKQPGTLAVPLVIRLHLPNGASLESASLVPVVEGNHLYFETDLRTDLLLEVNLRLP